MVTGNQVTNLLREIPHDPTKMTHESRHILYLSVVVEVMDIIEMQLAENNGTLVDFASGLTGITVPRRSFRITLSILSRFDYLIPCDWKEVDGKCD